MPPTSRSSWRQHIAALGAYTLLTLLFNWPLPAHLNHALTASVTGDAGVYVWNQWVFRHEAIAHHRFPLFTQEVLANTPPVDLSLHNYTLFANLVALPLRSVFGVIATFNLVYLALTVLTAWATFGLVRSLGVRRPEAWLAGAVFAFSPTLMARAIAHFSLASAAPLPLFLWTLHEGRRRGDRRFALLAGLVAGWAATWDAYFGVFCMLAAAAYFAGLYLRVARAPAPASASIGGRRVLDAFILLLAGLVLEIVATGGTDLMIAGQPIKLHSLYTPVLALTLAFAARWMVAVRPRLVFAAPPLTTMAIVVGLWAFGVGIALAPVLYALGFSLADGASLHGAILWRSSPPGVDLLALVLPNPNHAWFGETARRWLSTRPNGFPENAASLSLVVCAVLVAAAWRYRWRPARRWTVLAVFFALLSLGPFVHVGGVNTYIPGPWALLRYVPVVSATRTPTRYAIPLALAMAVLFAFALSKIGRADRRRRPLVLAVIALALLVELAPFPRPLYPAPVPEVYRIVAADPRDVRVMVLPFGFRSGEWSEGSFTSTTQYHQTFHEKALLGGYLSRIGSAEMARQHESFNIRYLVALSEGRPIAPADHETGKGRAESFVSRTRLGYVVMETAAVSPALRAYATDVFQLEKVAESDGYELFVPRVGTTASAAVR